VAVRWLTHIIWGVAALSFFAVDLTVAAGMSFIHTALTDIFGHTGLHRNRYHDMLAIFWAVLIAGLMKNPAFIVLGPLHIILDLISPGRWAVNWAYNSLFIALAAALLMARGVPL
jgi:hypothetical protein